MNVPIEIGDDGRFPLPLAELAGFVAYLKDNEVACDVVAGGEFHAGVEAFGFGHLGHPYDEDTVVELYRRWPGPRQGRAEEPARRA